MQEKRNGKKEIIDNESETKKKLKGGRNGRKKREQGGMERTRGGGKWRKGKNGG